MKKLFYLVPIIIMYAGAISCTPQQLEDTVPQACCGDDLNIPPPPPKSPIGG